MANSNKSGFQFWPKCTCNRRYELDNESDDYDDDDDSSFFDEESESESSIAEKFVFISVYKATFLKNTVIITDKQEIEKYRLQYSELTDKSVANVKNIWGSITVNVPILGSIALKVFIENLLKGSNKRKKQLKKPLPSMKLQNINSNSSEKSDTVDTEKSSSTMKLEKSKEDLTKGNKNSNKSNLDKKVEEAKTNSTPQTEDKKANVKIENKSNINNKTLQTVNNTDNNTEHKANITTKVKKLDNESKNQTPVNNTKPSINKDQQNNSMLANNINANKNKDQKHNSVNNIPPKISLENKNENKSNATNDSKNQKPHSLSNTPTKINLANKNENKSANKNKTKSDVTSDLKNQTSINNTKSIQNEIEKHDTTLNNIIKANMFKDQKSNSVNNTPSKVNSENDSKNKSTSKNENKNEGKSTPVNQNSTPKKCNAVNKNGNINVVTNGISKASDALFKALEVNSPKKTNKDEIKNSVNELKNTNVTEKFGKKDLASTPSKKTNTIDKNKQTSSNEISSVKQTMPEFKKPLDVKPILNSIEKNNAIKISNKSTTQVAREKTEYSYMYEETLDKATKKKLKKQKQKEKKKERNRRDSSNCSSRDTTDNSSPDSVIKKVNNNNKIIPELLKKAGKNEEEKQFKSSAENFITVNTEESEVEKDDQSEHLKTSDDDMDFLTDDENLPVFLAKIKEKSKNKEKNKVKADVSTAKNSNNVKALESKDPASGNNEQEFVIYSKKRNKTSNSSSNHVIDQNSIFYSESFAETACQMILENNFMGALEYLVEAIDFNYTDQRHYLNRCYCYLSMKKNALALADAEYIIQISDNICYLFLANVRAAQASYGLQRYEQAEAYMNEAMRINPTSMYVGRELILIQVARIVSMGFNEKDALLALEKYSSVQRALNYLVESNTEKLNTSKKEDLEISLDNCDEFDYSSDEDKPSNAEIVNRMMNYEPGTVKFQHIVAKPTNVHLIVSDNGKSMKKDKKALPNGKTNSDQDKAVWVGNLTSSITDTMLKKQFKQFGRVVSVYHPLNEAYAFINFEKAEDVTNVLANAQCHEVAGVKLLVKSAIRQK